MKFDIKIFDVVFIGLRECSHVFEFHVGDDFLNHFDYYDFNSCDVKVKVELDKRSNLLDFTFGVDGILNVDCDITNESFDMKLSPVWNLVVKFGTRYDDSDEQVLWMPYTEHKINIAHYIYETIILDMPMQKRHPKLNENTKESLKIKTFSGMKNKEQIDPRWNQLKSLLKKSKN